jgi:multidrug efflux pump subunit AcrB
MQLGLSISDIADKIARQSLDLPSGTIETQDADVLLRFADERRTVSEIEDLIVVSGETGAEIRLGDIAQIADRFELDEEKIIFNGKRAGLLQINKTKNQDALEVMNAVEDFLERERQLTPPGVEFRITQNVSKIVSDRLNLLMANGLQGLILVFLTMWLFFSFRFSFWVAMGLPVSFLGAIFFMNLIDFSLNMLTMVGLLIAIGLLMDDAIVIAENVATHLRRGKSPLTAVVDGVTEVRAGIFSSFLTTISIFGPLAILIEGDIGKVLWVIPVVLILTLSISLIEAFCILPNHLAHSLKGMNIDKKSGFRKRFEAFIDRIRENFLGRIVDWAVSWRYLFTGLVTAVFLVSVAMLAGGVIKTRAFPDIDGDVLQARILLPQGTPLKRTEAVVQRVTDALERVNQAYTPLQPEKQLLVQSVNVQFSQNIDAFETGSHVATVSADLLSAETRNAVISVVANRWRENVGEIPDVLNITFKEPVIGPEGLAIDIRLQGEDLNRLKQASLDLMHWLNTYEGVLDLNDDLRPGKPEIRVKLKKGVTPLGIDASTIANQLRSAFHGKTASEIQAGSESYEIDMRQASLDKDSIADLEYFHITTKSGKQIPLGTIASLQEGRGFARISRINSVRSVTIRGDVDTKVSNANDIIADTLARFLPQFKKRYPDVDVILEGQAKEGENTGKSMGKALMIGLFGIFILLSFQFKGYLEPLVIIVAIPLAFIGVIWGHIIMGLELSMPSIMGFVSLAGVVVNDSILLVTSIKRRIGEGDNVVIAAKTGSRLRFRAVLLTSLTTIMGLLPLLTERSLQAQVIIPLAASLVFGLITSTILVLIVIPALYTILGDLGFIVANSK